MFKLRIGQRTAVGFTVVLALTTLVSLVGWKSLGDFQQGVVLSKETTRLNTLLLETRVREKDFSQLKKQEDADAVLAGIARIREDAVSLGTRLDSEEEKRRTLRRMADQFETSVGVVVEQVSAAAAEELSSSISEIARNVEQAATGTQEVSSNITGVSQAATDTGAAATQIHAAAGELSQQSERLRGEVDKFLATARAA